MCQSACCAERSSAPSAKSDSQTKLFGFFFLFRKKKKKEREREIRRPTSVSLIKRALGTAVGRGGLWPWHHTSNRNWFVVSAGGCPRLARARRRWKGGEKGKKREVGMLTPPCVLPWGWARRPVVTHARYQPGPASHSAQPLPSPSRRMPSCYLLSFQQCVPRHPKTNAVAPPPSSTPPRLDGTPPPHHPKVTFLLGSSFFCQHPPHHRCCPHGRSAGLCFSGHLNLIYFPDGFPGFPLPLPGRASSESWRLPGCGHAPTEDPPAPPARWPWGTH